MKKFVAYMRRSWKTKLAGLFLLALISLPRLIFDDCYISGEVLLLVVVPLLVADGDIFEGGLF